MKRKHYAALIVIFAFALGCRAFWLSQKSDMDIDEYSSAILSLYNDYLEVKDYPYNEKFTGKQIKEMTLCNDSSIKDALSDIFYMWYYNRDQAHTNFYYSLLRIALTGLQTGDITKIIFRGGILNLILFAVSYFLFFLLLKRFFNDYPEIILMAIFCAFTSTASVSNALLLRPSQLQETMLILFTVFFYKYMNYRKSEISANQLFLNARFLFVMSFITALCLLSGYFSIIFIVFFGLYICYTAINKKDYNEIKSYLLVLLLAFLWDQIFYSRYISGYFTSMALPRTMRTIDGLGGFIPNISASFSALFIIINKHIFSIPFIAIGVILALYLFISKNKINLNNPILFAVIISLCYMVTAMLLAPYKILRYIMPLFPFLSIIPALLSQNILKKNIRYIFLILFCAVSIPNVLNRNKIEFLYQQTPEKPIFAKNTALPVFMINHEYFAYKAILPYLQDDQIYIFNNSFENIAGIENYDEFYLIINNNLIKESKFDIKDIENVKELSEFNGFFCMKISRTNTGIK